MFQTVLSGLSTFIWIIFFLVRPVDGDTLEPFGLLKYLDAPDLELIEEYFRIDG
jgi:hypothetical protein